MGPHEISTGEFDRFLSGLDYPMFVVTTFDGLERSGCLIGFATQCSIDPPRMLVCLSVANHTLRVAEGADYLGVHVLDRREHPLAELFGGTTGDDIDKFAECAWQPGPSGVPLLEDCPQHMVGRILQRMPLGDHVGHLLEPVLVSGADDVAPLSYDDAKNIDAGHPA